MKLKVYSTLLLSAFLIILLSGCGKKAQDPTAEKSGPSYNTKLWKKFDNIPPGADPSVADTLGGTGFEKVAEKMGFVTYTPKEEELKYFGDPRATKGGKITSIISRFPFNFLPFGRNSHLTENSIIGAFVYETLLGSHPITRDYVPSVATHWKISDDKRTFTFRMDPRARFSDGMPLTANDVVATWKLMMDETILDPSQQLTFGKFEEPKAISKYILEVKCKELNFRNLLYFSGISILPAHVIGKMTGTEFIDKCQFSMLPGSGPYILLDSDIKKGQQYSLTRRDDYWGKNDPMLKNTANFDRIQFDVVEDQTNLEYEKFKKGDQDFFLFNSLTTEKWLKDKYDAVDKGWIQKRRVFCDSPFGNAGPTFNMRKPPFDDIRVRKAFAHLFNRESMIKNLLFDEYLPTDSHHDNSVFESPESPVIRYNPELAASLLKEAGWTTKNSDGILMKNGKPFKLEFGIPKQVEKFVLIYQKDLRTAGIDLQLKVQDGNTLFKNAMARNFTIWWQSWTGLLTPNPETSYLSTLADKEDNNNIPGYKIPRVDELCRMYDTTFSRKEQIKIIQEIDKIIGETYADALTWYPKGIRIAYWNKFGMPETVLGRNTQLGYLDLTIFGTWWYDAEKAKALEEAKKSGGSLPIGKETVDYWKNFKDK
jgi:microcin C transport system substrate-binding protein